MALHDPVPIPAELAEPEPGAERWLAATLDYLVAAAADASTDPDALAADLVHAPSEHQFAPERATGWRITDDGAAEWAMRHVVAADAELAELREKAAEWMRRIQAWFDQAAAAPTAKRTFMAEHLRQYALDRRDADPKAKTLNLPSGKVTTREAKPRPVVADEDAVVEWADSVLPDAAAEVVAPKVRKVLVSELRDHVHVVERVLHARLLLHTGEVVEWRMDPDHQAACPGLGDAHGDDGLVAGVEVLASQLRVLGPNGLPVPGVEVEPGGVTATVVPA